MEISRDAYRAIEDIVGPDNVTDDPAFLDSYAFEWLAELVRPNRSHYMPRPRAVVMPARAPIEISASAQPMPSCFRASAIGALTSI